MKISPLTVQSKKTPQFERSKDDAIGEITQRGNTDKILHAQNWPGKERHGALKSRIATPCHRGGEKR
jgi:hypothetical protein